MKKSMMLLIATVAIFKAHGCGYLAQTGKGVIAGVAATSAVDKSKQYIATLMAQNNMQYPAALTQAGIDSKRLATGVADGLAVVGVSVFDRFVCGYKSIGPVGLACRLAGVFVGTSTAQYTLAWQQQGQPCKK